jgi:hypothetical protein
MADSIKDFKEELRALREEMFVNADAVDTKLVASYVDRLVLSLDRLADALEMLSVEVDTLSEAEPCICPPAARKKAKKPAKAPKKAKAAKKKKRR